MKIRDIYKTKRIPVVSISIMLLCVIITSISQLIPSMYMKFVFTYPVSYPWQFFTYVFLQGAPQELIPPDLGYSALELTIGHLGFNLLLILPFGILVEKVIGSRRMLLMVSAAWLIDAIALVIMGNVYPVSEGEIFSCAGASGVAFAFMPGGVCILFVLGKRYGFGRLFRQASFYLLMPIAVTTLVFALMPNIAGMANVMSMIIHQLGLFAGVSFTIIYRKNITGFVTKNDVLINSDKHAVNK